MTGTPALGRLYLVATPIGNLEDISLRALRILKSVDLIAAEDTRRTQKLLTHYDIHKPLTSYYKDVEYHKTKTLVAILRSGKSVALVTDAGMPGISDPGLLLVQAVREQGISMEIIPGPSAVLTALAGSGLPAEPFTFHGFLESKPGVRKKQLEKFKARPETQVFFVAPHRLPETLVDLLTVWGDRQTVLCRELTKIHEEFTAGALSSLIQTAACGQVRGEYTLVVAGASAEAEAESEAKPVEETLEAQLLRLQQAGLSLNQAVGQVARERKLARRLVYNLAHHCQPPSENEAESLRDQPDGLNNKRV